MCNLDPKRKQDLNCDFRGAKPSTVSGRILTAGAVNRGNTFASPDAVKPAAFEGAAFQGGTLRISLPAKSVVMLEVR